MGTKEDDWVEHLFVASTHDYVLFFTDKGRVYWLKVYDIPQGGRAARGKPVINLIQIQPGERIAAFVAVRDFSDDRALMFATQNGIVKKTVLSAYGNPRASGINAINIEDDDELIEVQVTDGTSDVVLATRNGMSIRFSEKDVRPMGRTTTGVRGVQLGKDDRVIGMVIIRRDATLLVVSERGLGKRSQVGDYRVQKRGGKGIITLKRTERTGAVVALREVLPEDELMIVTRHGVIIRLPVDGIRVIGRNTQGVKVMNLDAGDTVMDVARVVREEEGEVDVEGDGPQIVAQGKDQREIEL
jgi:DNA gyrase subunit A